MKRFLPSLLSIVLLMPITSPFGAKAADDVSFTLTVNGIDTNISNSSVVVFPNNTSEPRFIPSENYNFRNASLMIFNKNGKLIEAGGQLLANTDGKNGSPQLKVKIPAGGFMVGFGASSNKDLLQCYSTAFEGAMLYNSTMSIIYDVNGAFNPETNSVSISYNKPKPVSEGTTKFLIVGNSATYFNGTPLKFKALCREAGVDVSVTYCTFGSAFLSQFADEKHSYGSELRNKLKNNKYDYVVLQDAGSALADDTDAALAKLVPLIRENGAKPLLYMRYSSTSYVDKRPSGNVYHYNTYTALAEKYDTVAAPAAVAYYYCQQDGVDIELYADDHSHHSAAGSYLIACTWLKAFMGISPVGNSYTADLDQSTAETLQKIALRSCDEPFEPEKVKPAVFKDDDGNEYTNIAFEKPYKVSGTPYSGVWTDTKEDGSPIGKWTDGLYSKNGADSDIGCWKGSPIEVVIDLGGVFSVKRLTTDLFGGTWGVPHPSNAAVQFLVSEDGVNFKLFGDGVAADGDGVGDWTRFVFSYTASETVNAAYVKVIYKIGGNFCWVSEIEAFGTEGASEHPVDTSSDAESTAEVSDIPDESDSAESSGSLVTESSKSPEKSNNGIAGKLLLAGAGALALVGAVAAVFIKRKNKK